MDRYRSIEDMDRRESEAGILATLVHHPEYIYHSEFLQPKHFSDRDNQLLFEALKGLGQDGVTDIDAYIILEYLKKYDPSNADALSLESVRSFVEEQSSSIARHSTRDYMILVSNVFEAAFRKEMYVKLDECKSILLDPDEEDVCKRIYSIVDNVATSYADNEAVEPYSKKLDGLWKEIENRQGDGYSGIPFKFPLLNDYVTIERGELIIFGAQQKVGKSIMLLNCAVDLLRRGYSVLYIDSELSDRLFTARMLAHLSGVTYKNLTSGNYSEEETDRIMGSMTWLKNSKFEHIYMPYFSAEEIYRTVKRVNHTMPIDVLVVDYFKSTGNDMDAFQTYASMGKCVDVIKNEIAGAMNIAAIGAAQATATNKLADSAKIARNASTIVMLVDKTPEEIEADNADGRDCGNKKMIVTINRNGMQHAQGEYIDLAFDGSHISYEQAKNQHIPTTPY